MGDGGNVDAFRRRCRLDGNSGKMNFKKAALVYLRSSDLLVRKRQGAGAIAGRLPLFD